MNIDILAMVIGIPLGVALGIWLGLRWLDKAIQKEIGKHLW